MENYMFHKSNVSKTFFFFPLSLPYTIASSWPENTSPFPMLSLHQLLKSCVSSSNSCKLMQIFCVAVVHRPESITFLLLWAMCRQLYRTSSSHVQTKVKPLKWREMFICCLWAPSPTRISAQQGKRRSLPGWYSQLTRAQLSHGGVFWGSTL